jgi:hypothetical protein
MDVEACLDGGQDRGPPGRRKLAPGGRDADQQRCRAPRERQRLVERRDDRDVVTGQPLPDVAAGDRGVQHGDDVVRPVADHPNGGLGVMDAELALGEDDEPAGRRRVHRSRV